MSLKHVDSLVREGKLQAALQAIEKTRAAEPKNAYAQAYEERVRALLLTKAEPAAPDLPAPGTPHAVPPPSRGPLPSPEEQLLRIATPLPAPTDARARESDRLVLLGSIAEILGRANEHLSHNAYGPALEEIARARALDGTDTDLQALEVRVRAWQAETAARIEEEQRAAEAAERRARDEREHAERERTARVQEEQRRRDEEVRRAAQRRKIDQYLERSRTLVDAGDWQQARTELRFVTAIDPANGVAAAIAADIARCEAAERERQALAHELTDLLRDADELVADKRFAEARALVDRGEVLMPGSPDLEACRQRIAVALREEERREAERILAEEEEHRRRAAEEEERALQQEIADAEERRRADREKIVRHLESARIHLTARAFDDALAEVALAFSLDPFDEDVRLVEQQILSARTSPEPAPPAPRPAEPEYDSLRENERLVAGYLADAGRLMKAGRLDEALSAVLRIRILDPMNDEARHIEGMIQAELGRSSITVSSEGLSDPSLGMPDLSRFAEQHPSHAVVDEPGEAESAASLPQPLEAEASDSPLAEPPRRSRKVFFIAVAGAAGLGLFSALAGVLSSRSGAEGNAVGVIESTTQATVQAQDHPVTPGTGTASPARSGKGSEARKQQTSPGEPAPAAEAPVEPAYELIPTTIPGVVKLAQPVILSDALSAEQEEQITVKILVTAGGRPVTAMVTRSTNSALDALVVAAVMHSEFEQRAPDQPDHWITIPFSFTR